MKNHTLTKNQQLVFERLTKAKAPLTAYTILDEIRSEGIKAPLQVYRALEKLMELGIVHRLESLNAFIACSHPSCGEHNQITAFTICETCGTVNEVSDTALKDHLTVLGKNTQFILKQATLELRGLCQACQPA